MVDLRRTESGKVTGRIDWQHASERLRYRLRIRVPHPPQPWLRYCIVEGQETGPHQQLRLLRHHRLGHRTQACRVATWALRRLGWNRQSFSTGVDTGHKALTLMSLPTPTVQGVY
jgi:hypothetical protein